MELVKNGKNLDSIIFKSNYSFGSKVVWLLFSRDPQELLLNSHFYFSEPLSHFCQFSQKSAVPNQCTASLS